MGVEIARTEYSGGLGEFNDSRDRFSDGHTLILQYVGDYLKAPTTETPYPTCLGKTDR
jgi:hypothetical protein